MKKYFLSLLIFPLLLIGGFSSAYLEKVYCITENNPGGMANPCYVPDSFDSFVCVGNDTESVKFNKKTGGLYTLHCPFSYDTSILGSLGANRYYSPSDNVYLVIENGLPDPLVPGGVSGFTPVITGLTNSINEFIPYVVYIGLGVLGVLIGFVAIKRLINWVRAKIFSSFK